MTPTRHLTRIPTHPRRRRLRHVAIAVAAGLAVAACGSDSDDTTGDDTANEGTSVGDDTTGDGTTVDDGTTGDGTTAELGDRPTLALGIDMFPEAIVPSQTTGSTTNTIVDQVFDGLLRIDPEGSNQPVPSLATGYELSDDGLVYTFDLRDGVTFHDGTPFGADAVLLNYERLTDETSPYYWELGAPTAASQVYGDVASVEAIDDLTVAYTLSAPNADFPFKLVQPYADFVSPEVIRTVDPDEVGSNPVGAGPFSVAEISDGDVIRLEAFDDHWNGPPTVAEIAIRAFPEPGTLVAALASGEVDVINGIPVTEAQNLGDDLDTFAWNLDQPYLVALNFEHPVTSDPQVREAINLAIDRQSIVDDLLGGFGRVANGPYSPDNAAFNPDVQGYDYDPDRARELMAEAGYPDGVDVGAIIPNEVASIPLVPEFTQTIQQELAEIGLNVDYEVVEFGAYLDIVRQGLTDDHIFYLTTWALPEPGWLELLHGESNIAPDGPNRGFYRNDEVFALFDEARSEADADRRVELYQEAEQLIVDDGAWLYTAFYPLLGAKQSNIGNIGKSIGSFDLSRVTFDG